MLFNKPKYNKLTIMEILSDDILQYSLESLDWQKITISGKQIEQIKIKAIPNSQMSQIIFTTMFESRMKLGDWIYSRVGNRIERFNPAIAPIEHKKEAYSVSKPFTVDVDLSKKRIVKIE